MGLVSDYRERNRRDGAGENGAWQRAAAGLTLSRRPERGSSRLYLRLHTEDSQSLFGICNSTQSTVFAMGCGYPCILFNNFG